MQYLQGTFDTAQLSRIKISEPLIQKGDLLGITVYSDDPLATAAVTNPVTNGSALALNSLSSASALGSASSSGSSTLQGFIVSEDGFIQLYKIGAVTAVGKTKKQLSDTLALLYANQGLLKNPYVEVRFLNYKVTVIGEVSKPGSYSVPTDRLNAFEAIGLAGDITSYGRRDNVLVVREVNGVREFGKLNLKDPNVFLSPFYYLQQNDMIVVDVARNKSYVNNQNTLQYISIGTSIISIAAVIYSLIRR
jgi:polysaccharide export outer membrane protein